MARNVKLGEILGSLIDEGGYKRNRIKICEAARVSPAALSQYLSSRTRPSFDVLIRLAEFFDVSLDYLVFGHQLRSAAVPDYAPLARYVDLSLSRIQDRSLLQAALVARVGNILAGQISKAVNDVLQQTTAAASGLMTDNEIMLLETFADETFLISMNLQYDVIEIPGSEEEAAGRFLPVVAANLNNGRSYRFLVTTCIQADWSSLVARMRRLLTSQCSAEIVHARCQFRASDAPVFSGIGIYRLDLNAIQSEQPAFFEIIRDYVDDKGWLSYTMPPSSALTVNALHDTIHQANARRLYEILWKTAKPI